MCAPPPPPPATEERSECIAQGEQEEEEGLQLLFMSAVNKGLIGVCVSPQQVQSTPKASCWTKPPINPRTPLGCPVRRSR